MMSTPEHPAREQWATKSDEHRTDFERAESPVKYQVAAWILWVVGAAVEFGGALAASGALRVPVLTDLPVLTAVLVIVLGLVLVLLAQRMWKKASGLVRGTSGQGAVGVAMACVAYIPMFLFFVTAKNATAKTKGIAVASSLVSAALIVALCWLLSGDPLTVGVIPAV